MEDHFQKELHQLRTQSAGLKEENARLEIAASGSLLVDSPTPAAAASSEGQRSPAAGNAAATKELKTKVRDLTLRLESKDMLLEEMTDKASRFERQGVALRTELVQARQKSSGDSSSAQALEKKLQDTELAKEKAQSEVVRLGRELQLVALSKTRRLCFLLVCSRAWMWKEPSMTSDLILTKSGLS